LREIAPALRDGARLPRIYLGAISPSLRKMERAVRELSRLLAPSPWAPMAGTGEGDRLRSLALSLPVLAADLESVEEARFERARGPLAAFEAAGATFGRQLVAATRKSA
jgi:hypothetical protein